MIHPSAVIEGDVTIGEGCEIGPHCTIRGNVTLGAGNRLIAAKQGDGGIRVEQGCGHGKMERRRSVASGCAR